MMLKEMLLLKDKPSSAILAVSDLDRARDFYAGTLGLELARGAEQDVLGLTPAGGEGDELAAYRSGAAMVWVYRSEFAGTNKANAVVWNAGEDFDAIAEQLKEQDISFEEYPDLGMDISGGIHRQGEFKGIWFKDPDGNILHIENM